MLILLPPKGASNTSVTGYLEEQNTELFNYWDQLKKQKMTLGKILDAGSI